MLAIGVKVSEFDMSMAVTPACHFLNLDDL